MITETKQVPFTVRNIYNQEQTMGSLASVIKVVPDIEELIQIWEELGRQYNDITDVPIGYRQDQISPHPSQELFTEAGT